MKSVKSVTVAFAFLSLLAANAFSETNYTINRIGSWGNGNFFFQTVQGGATQYYFSITTDAGKSLMAVILASYAQGKNVSFNQSGGVVSQVWTE